MTKNLFKNKTNKIGKQSGFTLIEMIVSVGLFAVVMTISVGVILSVIDGNRKTQAINSVVNNLNFSIDAMVRDIKTGHNYYCAATQNMLGFSYAAVGSGCAPGTASNFISFLSSDGRSITYRYDSTQKRIFKDIYLTTGGGATSYPVTSTEISVNQPFGFYVSTPSPSIGQPKVFLVLSGTASTSANSISNFSLQTTISQRVLNI